MTIGYVEVAGDARYEPVTGFGRLVLKQRERPFTGAQVGLDEAQALTRVLKTDFALERISVSSPAEVAGAVSQARDARGINFFIVDAPAEAFKPLAAAVKGRDILVFNPTAADDALRRDLCAAEIIHTLPSLAMGMDALVQYLASRKWNNLLVFEGPLPADAVMAKALENSAKKFGARVVARQQFKPGASVRRTIRRCCPPSTATTTWCSSPITPSTSPGTCPTTPCGRGRWSAASTSSPWPGTGPGSTTARRR
jgi:ABC transporter substrate binding protein (PQQ-dependent alcohol dehydrogenase system)